MPIIYEQHTVLQFTKIQFKGKWTLAFGSAWLYTPENNVNEVLVVTQAPDSTKITYLFSNLTDTVLVGYTANIAEIPALCKSSKPGDTTTCGEK